ncbi:MAG: B12-binding domain-containing radical SAM protein [Deltaproteobacteria bacterium]|nr:B12-binding domain-containing radical SAM protein [Deltaproteobacteria bacterium]
MKAALVYPPTCDPTAPYLSVPALTGFLRAHGVEVLPIDANIEAWGRLLTRDALAAFAERVKRRRRRLARKAALRHVEQLALTALSRARSDARTAPDGIEDALAVLRDRNGARFFDNATYGNAVATVESALRVVSAAHAPLCLDFASYRTPFSLLDMEAIEADARPERDPFHGFFTGELAERLRAFSPRVVGVSVAFPGQIQPAFSLAFALRRLLPDAHLVVGGPAMTQLLVRLGDDAPSGLGPFHAAVLFEGEQALLDLVRAADQGAEPRGVVRGMLVQDLGSLPAPDFSGLPLDKYLSPGPVLPYDPTRGCYHGKCAFCHYGLSETGTAPYRERPAGLVVEHLAALRAAHGCRVFHLSEDSIAPKTLRAIAREVKAASLGVRMATDMRPEKALDAEACRELADGGVMAVALGLESGSPRILAGIGKGIGVEDAAAAAESLATAGIAVEAMVFTGFPTETEDEALATVRLLERLRGSLSLFMCGEFHLTAGSAIARRPEEFGVAEVWGVEGDRLRTGLFYREAREPVDDRGSERIERAVDKAASGFLMRSYPWAGSLSTAHTLLWAERFGPDVFRRLSGASRAAQPKVDPDALGETALSNEARIWHEITHVRRFFSRELYRELAEALPSASLRRFPRKRR